MNTLVTVRSHQALKYTIAINQQTLLFLVTTVQIIASFI